MIGWFFKVTDSGAEQVSWISFLEDVLVLVNNGVWFVLIVLVSRFEHYLYRTLI